MNTDDKSLEKPDKKIVKQKKKNKISLINPDNLHWLYYRPDKNKNKSSNGIVCVGWTWDDICKHIKYTVSICSPKDQFKRTDAKRVILGRYKADYWAVVECDERPTLAQARCIIAKNYNENAKDDDGKFAKRLGFLGLIPMHSREALFPTFRNCLESEEVKELPDSNK